VKARKSKYEVTPKPILSSHQYPSLFEHSEFKTRDSHESTIHLLLSMPE